MPMLYDKSREIPHSLSTSFESEVLPHYASLYGLALNLTRKPDAAEDLVQETLTKALRFFDRYHSERKCKAWLMTIMKRLFCTNYRRERRELLAFDGDLSDIAADEGLETRTVQRTDLENSLGRVNPAFREVVVHSDIYGIPLNELSKGFGIPIGTVKSRLFRGRRDLREQLADYGYNHNVEF